jgi:hypothetical protein
LLRFEFLKILSAVACQPPQMGCPLGKYYNTTTKTCLDCSPGSYSGTFNLTYCSQCDPGKFSKLSGQTSCTLCPRHTYSDSYGSKNCSQCLSVEDSPPGSTSKSNCSANFCLGYEFSSSSWGYHRIKVPPGSINWYQANAKCAETFGSTLANSTMPNSMLISNEASWIAIQRVSSSAFVWVDFSPGFPLGTTIPPPVNYYKPSGSQPLNCVSQIKLDRKKSGAGLRMTPCSDTQETSVYCQINSMFCSQPCSAGLFYDTDSLSCRSCAAGKFSNDVRVSSCSLCSLGEFTTALASTKCEKCDFGKFADTLGFSSCQPCPQNAVTFTQASTALSDCICNRGYYGRAYDGQDCILCSQEATSCDFNSSKPFVNPGFWKAPGIDQYYHCIPPEACNYTGFGNSTLCSDGYTGLRCGQCIELKYYKVNGECKKCGNEALKWIFLVSVVLVIALLLMRITSVSNVSFPHESRVAYSWIQIIGLFPSLFDQWPDTLLGFLRFFSFANIDLDFVSPECSFSVNFWSVLHLKMMFPFIVIGSILLLALILKILSTRIFALRSSSTDFRVLPFRVPVMIFSLSYTYIFVQMSKPFSCSHQPDGSYTLIASSNLGCFDKTWKTNLDAVIVYIILYTIVLPGLCGGIFFWYRKNPSDTLFLQRFGLITTAYRTEVFWWELISIFKKGIFAVTSNIFASFLSDTTRHFITLCILFIFFMTEIVSLPYIADFTNKVNLL